MSDSVEGNKLQHTDCRNFPCYTNQWRHLLSTATLMFPVLLAGILQGVERPGSVCSIMPQWWHLMVLQHAAASFHQTSVSTANINTVQYTLPHKQCEIPTIPSPVTSKVLHPQSTAMAAFVHSHRKLSDVSPGTEAPATCSAAQQQRNCPGDVFWSGVRTFVDIISV
jgi:hypothetical protein